jgi:transcriptional regulator with XRE-family HTH domain
LELSILLKKKYNFVLLVFRYLSANIQIYTIDQFHFSLTEATYSLPKVNFYLTLKIKNMQIGSKLKRLREMKNLKQEDIAQKLNISKQAYSKIERDETKLDIDRIVDLSEILETTPEELLKNEGVNFNQAKECDSPNMFTGAMSTINNHYYYGNEQAPLLQKTIESHLETIKRQEAEIAYLRKLVEEQLIKK